MDVPVAMTHLVSICQSYLIAFKRPQHIGKMPGARSNVFVIKKQIEDIRKRMKAAVDEEQFEEAAKLRDEAKNLEQQLQFEGGDVS
ncbi:hypothetical protein LSPH24S_04783 [Lysinibacillus sphaericus]